MKCALTRWTFAALIIAGYIPVQAEEIIGNYSLSNSSSGATVITSDSELVFNGDFYFDSGVTIKAPKISFLGSSTKLSSGAVVLSGSDSSYTGTTTLSGGTLMLSSYTGTTIPSGGTQMLSSYTGTTTLSGGSLMINSNNFGEGTLMFSSWGSDVPELTLESLGEIQIAPMSEGTFMGTTAIPEPATYALIFGLVTMAFVIYRKRA